MAATCPGPGCPSAWIRAPARGRAALFSRPGRKRCCVDAGARHRKLVRTLAAARHAAVPGHLRQRKAAVACRMRPGCERGSRRRRLVWTAGAAAKRRSSRNACLGVLHERRRSGAAWRLRARRGVSVAAGCAVDTASADGAGRRRGGRYARPRLRLMPGLTREACGRTAGRVAGSNCRCAVRSGRARAPGQPACDSARRAVGGGGVLGNGGAADTISTGKAAACALWAARTCSGERYGARFRDEASQAHTAVPLHASALKSHTCRVHGASLVPCLRARLLLGSDEPVRQL